MKKKRFALFGLIGLMAVSVGGMATAVVYSQRNDAMIVAKAEGEEEFEAKVSLPVVKHGEITVSKTEGHVGDIVEINAKHDLLYKIKFVAVNGTNLVESEETAGLYSFALVEGENVISAEFVIDEELLGEMSVIMNQAIEKDWTHLFRVENVIRIVTFILNGGLLIAMVRYFVKDKRIAASVERSVSKTVAEIVPDSTKQTVLVVMKEVFEPMFSQVTAYQSDIVTGLSVLAKCTALAQENTPESRKAILDELTSTKIGDMKTIEEAKQVIDNFVAEKLDKFNETMSKLDNISNKNKENIKIVVKEK